MMPNHSFLFDRYYYHFSICIGEHSVTNTTGHTLRISYDVDDFRFVLFSFFLVTCYLNSLINPFLPLYHQHQNNIKTTYPKAFSRFLPAGSLWRTNEPHNLPTLPVFLCLEGKWDRTALKLQFRRMFFFLFLSQRHFLLEGELYSFGVCGC